jgi:hypothetical protein
MTFYSVMQGYAIKALMRPFLSSDFLEPELVKRVATSGVFGSETEEGVNGITPSARVRF